MSMGGALIDERSGAFREERSGALIDERSGALMDERSGALIDDRSGALIDERSGALIDDRSGALIDDRSGALMEERSGAAASGVSIEGGMLSTGGSLGVAAAGIMSTSGGGAGGGGGGGGGKPKSMSTSSAFFRMDSYLLGSLEVAIMRGCAPRTLMGATRPTGATRSADAVGTRSSARPRMEACITVESVVPRGAILWCRTTRRGWSTEDWLSSAQEACSGGGVVW